MSLSMQVDTSQVDRFVQKFPASGPQIAERELRAAMDDSLEYTVNQVVDFTPVNTGVLRESVYGRTLEIEAHALRGVAVSGVVSSSDYEPKVTAVEFGRKPGKMPPVEAILLWVKRKKLTAGAPAGGKRKKVSKSKAQLKLAWAIAISIARRGTKAQLMFQQGFDQSIAFIEKRFDEAVERIVNAWSRVE